MNRLLRRRAGNSGPDDGMGMILVIGIITIVSAMVAVSAGIAVNAVLSSHNRVTYEQALATAENGVDFALGQLHRSFDETNSDWPTPAPATTHPSSGCNSAIVSQTATSEAAQRAEARANLEAIAAIPGKACVHKGAVGEYVIWKPPTPLVNGLYPKHGRVYAMGFVPSYQPGNKHMKTRLIKAEYLFMPYRPTNAVLTGGNLHLDSSTKVTAAYGVASGEASVHSNGSITSSTGNPTVYGNVTSTGNSTASSTKFYGTLNITTGTVASLPKQRIPVIDAEALYYRTRLDHPEYATYSSTTMDSTTYLGPWYDMCSDGYARPRAISGEPCTSGIALNPGAQNSFRGWSYDSGTHVWKASNATQSGIYYVHEGSVTVGGGTANIANISVIAQAKDRDSCSGKKYGNIEWDGYTMQAPAFTNLFMYADSDIVTHSSFTAGQGSTAPPVISGMFVAGDQMHMETSSAGAVGSVVVGDQCTSGNPDLVTSSEIKNPEIYYDPNADAPFTSIISTTLWLEYVN